MRTLQPIEGAKLFQSPYMPMLIKAEESGKDWLVYLQASNELQDQDGEVILSEALKKAADYYVSHGVLSWDHKHKELNDPSYIIGEPTDVSFSGSNETLIKGRLYKENRRAQGVMENILSDSSRLGASVGGYVLQKSKQDGVSTVSTVYWDETAITHKPVNDHTLGKVSRSPFQEFMKALLAGSGVDAAQFSGGRALSGEELQGATPIATADPELVALFKDIWIAVKQGEIYDKRSLLGYIVDCGYTAEVAQHVAALLSEKLPAFVGK